MYERRILTLSEIRHLDLKKVATSKKSMKNSRSFLPLIHGIKRTCTYALPFAAFWLICSAKNALSAKKGRRNAKEKHKEKAVQLKKYRLNDSIDRIRQVIRNRSILKEAPFLRDSELHESLGFDVIRLLLQISIELIDQFRIDASNDSYLLKRAMER